MAPVRGQDVEDDTDSHVIAESNDLGELRRHAWTLAAVIPSEEQTLGWARATPCVYKTRK